MTRSRRSNAERTESTRRALVSAGRSLFIARGYAESTTPSIAAEAGVTRGALYHHFPDKRSLFRAVVEQEAADVASAIENATIDSASAIDALILGGDAFLAAMRERGRTRLLLLDAPAVLGRTELDKIDDTNGARTLREGLCEAMACGEMHELPVEPLAAVLSAAFDRAALAIEAGANERECRQVLTAIITGIARQGGPARDRHT